MKTIWLAATLLFSSFATAEIHLEKIKLPEGFKISVYAKDLVGARSMAWGKNGILFVGSRTPGQVIAIDSQGKQHLIASKLNMPNGVAFIDGTLYVAEIHRLIKFEHISDLLDSPPAPVVVKEFPSDGSHGWKYLAMGPGKRLYWGQGAPCNICDFKDPYGTIQSIDPKSGEEKIVARGVRNTVGFDWHPVTGQLWFTDNGRDMLGEDIPADELNRIDSTDPHFGFPYCHAGDIVDPEFGRGKECSSYKAPVRKLGAHVAALGMKFYTGQMFPEKYTNQVFIAEHGSWNRKIPDGYRVSLVTINEKYQAVSYETFASGWLNDRQPWGRPVDLLLAPDGSMLVSDDFAGAIYKISYTAKN